jgi:thymidylate synthase (FAD)
LKIVSQSIELIDITPNAVQKIAKIARVCYQSDGDEEENIILLRKIIARNHLSLLEHAYATFRITTDRAIANELTRHRHATFTQESSRYVCYGNIEVIPPDELRGAVWNYPNQDWSKAIWECEKSYTNLINNGVSPQIARSVLPLCLKTELIMTANFREWKYILDLRSKSNCHPQMVELMKMISKELANQVPEVFNVS